MTTPEDKLSALEGWIDTNKDAVATFTGVVTSINAELQKIAQRVASNEAAISTVAEAVKTVNDKTLVNENKTATDSSIIDSMEAGRAQVLNQLETIVNKAAADTSETHTTFHFCTSPLMLMTAHCKMQNSLSRQGTLSNHSPKEILRRALRWICTTIGCGDTHQC